MDAKPAIRKGETELPESQLSEQVHLARRFGASNLVKTPFTGISGPYGVTVSVTWAVWEMPVVVPVAVIGRV
jgi:hypothetical protein